MEACVGAHHLARKLKSLGHDARLMPAKYVRPYAKGQKNDFNDAEAIAEALQRPTMIRAFLLERGVAVRQGLRFLRAELPRCIASANATRRRGPRRCAACAGRGRRCAHPE
jgi:transposase